MELDSLKWMSILSHAMVVGTLRRVMFLIAMEDEVVGIFMWIYASNTFSVSMLKQVIYASNTFTVSMLKHLYGLAGGERRRVGMEAGEDLADDMVQSVRLVSCRRISPEVQTDLMISLFLASL